MQFNLALFHEGAPVDASGYNAAAVREATIGYNDIKARARRVGEIIPLSRMEALAEAV